MSRESIYSGVLAFRLENTKYVISYINNNERLLERCLNAGKSGIEKECFDYAYEHNEEFGNRLVLELYDVFWDKVWNGIRKK